MIEIGKGLDMLRRFFILIIFGISCLVFAQDDTDSAILDLVNNARTNDSIPALHFNQQLEEAAQHHSSDMAVMDNLTHIGSDGSQFWERIQATGYPLATGAENVLARGDTNPESAFEQWFNSDAHRTNMLNPDYLEVGIAYSRSASGRYYFTMLLASPTGMLPPEQASATAINTAIPTIAPSNTAIPITIIPSNTPIPPTATWTPTLQATNPLAATIAAPLPTYTQQVFTPAPLIVTNTVIPSPTDYVPPDIRLVYDYNSLTLYNISGKTLNLANLIFESSSASMAAKRWDTEFLTQPLSGFTNGDCLQVWGLESNLLPKPEGCRYRHSWISVAQDNTFWRNTDSFTVRNGGQRVGLCSVPAGICEVNLFTPIDENISVQGTPTGTQLRFVYNADSFTLINVSGQVLDIRGITFRSDSGTMPVERWDTEFLTQPLTSFRSGDCVQAWTFAVGETVLPAPEGCVVRQGWIAVGDDYDFWRNTDSFTVERYGIIIGRCSTSDTVCEVSLSANLGTAQDDFTTASDANSDVRLFITDASVTLMNTSNDFIDISSLVFESSSGVFPATRWQIPELSQPLYAIPASGCLQIWGVNEEYLAAPRACSIRHAWLAVALDAQFWRNTNVFTVRSGDQILAACETRTEICDFNLP